ncbi:MAG: biotin transporter BioY [Actinomycetia bacterium]|nr:biotin transporter BioY [Actinomycetes bacterium]
MINYSTVGRQNSICVPVSRRYPDLLLKFTFSIVFAFLMAISANAFIYLPFTPVPVTLQVLTVVFSALMLGGPWALAGQLIYISMGLAGMPVFAGFIGGPAFFYGPTAGYVIGFAIAAYISGLLFNNRQLNSILRGNTLAAGFISGAAGLLIIYLLGSVHLFGFLYSLSNRQQIVEIAGSVWILGVKPFIIPDLIKILIAIKILESGSKGYEKYKNK